MDLMKYKYRKMLEMNAQGIDQQLINDKMEDINRDIDELTKLGCPPDKILGQIEGIIW